jgi:peptidyl-prolyl cis-trans isomerase SurA
MQEISAQHKDLLRNLIDQQLWLSKGKELDITGETELVKKLDEIRKQYNLESIEDLEKAARSRVSPSRTSRPTSATRSSPSR